MKKVSAMRHKWLFLLILLLSITFLGGCWSRKEMTDLAFVTGVGIDKAKDKNEYRLTLQVVNPGNFASIQQSGGGGGSGPPVAIFSATGQNIIEASSRNTLGMSRELYYAHTNLLVIGEELAREKGIYDILDAFERDAEFRDTATVVIAKGTTAENMIKTLTPVDKIPATRLIKVLENTEKSLGENMSVDIDAVIGALVSTGKEPIISGFSVIGNKRLADKQESLQASKPGALLVADSMGIIRNGKLIHWISRETARGVLWIQGKVKGSSINIDWQDKKKAIAIEAMREKTKIKAHIKRGKPLISVYLKVEGRVGETDVSIDLKDPNEIEKMERLWDKEIEKEVIEAIKMAQQQKSDIFGFGDIIHDSYPNLWKNLESNWDTTNFPKLAVDVSVKTSIRHTGLRNKSFLTKIKH